MSVRKDGAFIKKERLKQLTRFVVQNLPANKERVLSYAEIEIGLSRKRAQEYLDLCAHFYGWTYKDGMVQAVPKNET